MLCLFVTVLLYTIFFEFIMWTGKINNDDKFYLSGPHKPGLLVYNYLHSVINLSSFQFHGTSSYHIVKNQST